MPASDDELLKRLRATFRAEAQEHIQTMSSGLVELEQSGRAPGIDVLDRVFRAAHSLKGAARAVNVSGIESLCQALEGVFSAIRRGGLTPSAALFDLLHRSVDTLADQLSTLDGGPTPAQQLTLAELRNALQVALAPSRAAAGEAEAAAAVVLGHPQAVASAVLVPPPAASRALPDSVRVAKHTLDAVLLQTEELLYAKTATAQRAAALRRMQHQQAAWRKRGAGLRADVRNLERALAAPARESLALRVSWERVRDYLDASDVNATLLESELLRHACAAEQDLRTVGQMVDQLLEEIKRAAVQPFSTLLDLFPASVRELARDCGKEVELAMQGGDIEIDRRILDEMKDPLIQLVRNSIDHGIEPPPVRRARGKPARGRLSIEVAALPGHLVRIVVRDDGAGFDAVALRQSAARAGLQPADSDDLLTLACAAGVSTSPLVTNISGRGLGLSIVKQQIERLTGTLQLESAPGTGTSFRIVLPLTLARFRGVLLRLGRQLFVVPTRAVEYVARVRAEDVRRVENRETVTLLGRVLALARLDQVLGLPASEAPEGGRFQVAVLRASQQPIAFRVDEVFDEREVLVKPLGSALQQLRHVAGASVIDSGRVVPILHVPDVLASAAARAGAAPAPVPAGDAGTASRKSVLVAEDSITSRTLLKGILETAGYRVETAADGVDAFTVLRSGEFDLVVSDVDMPRMNGFGLTAKIRADKKLRELPVVLVTALESREDREHGIDVGANAYIVKSSFDQSNLLEIVRRLA